jgi:hypothetical protein
LHSKWVLGNDCDRFIIIENELSLSPENVQTIVEYYEKAKHTYEKMETIFYV